MTVFEKTSFGFGFGLVDFSHHEAGSGLGLWLRFIYFKFNNMEIDQAKQRQAKPEKCEAEASRFKNAHVSSLSKGSRPQNTRT